MHFLEYRADILPHITLIGKNLVSYPHINIRRKSSDYIFYIVTSGELSFIEDGTEYTLKKGDCFLFEPNKLHYGTKKTKHNIIYIHFKHNKTDFLNIPDKEWLDKMQANSIFSQSGEAISIENSKIIIPKYFQMNDSSAFYDICKLAEKAIDQNKLLLENCNVLCSLAVSELFIELYRQYVFSTFKNNNEKTVKIHLVNSVVKYLNQNYQNKLTGEIIEKELCYNFDYLNQLFKKYLNTSIFKMLEQIRMEHAIELLKISNASMEIISESVGFKDESYFSKTFKKNTGVSPTEYRKQFITENL